MTDNPTAKATPPFQYLITLDPLGLLYGSAGRFLSPENLVGRSGTHFPPTAATLSGLFAAYYNDPTPEHQNHKETFDQLQLAGPFWAKSETPQDFHVPTPMHCLATMHPNHEDNDLQTGYVGDRLQYHAGDDQPIHWRNLAGEPPEDKFARGTWVNISDWETLSSTNKTTLETIPVYTDPWINVPHLHPYLKPDERRVDSDRQRGSLFLENGVQMIPDTCLVYLSNLPVASVWYRFGGEGHMVDLQCHDLTPEHRSLLSRPLGNSFALITPAIWGSNRLSYRDPQLLKKGNPERHSLPEVDSDLKTPWTTDAILTERPTPFRYRLGHRKTKEGETIHEAHQPKLLSRGRYAVPAGSVYVTQASDTTCWHDWPEDWFPKEGPSLKRWGCGLSLPLTGVMASETAEKAVEGAIA